VAESVTDWRNLSFGVLSRRGSTERKVVTDERDGSVAGTQTEHWDDHVDAEVRLKPIRLKARRVARS
jgi:hypothetical protein